MLGIFLLALTIRSAWTLDAATEDGFKLTGGSDPYYHKRVVDYVMENGEHLVRDEMLNYPYGANNNRPPLFDWSIAIAGLVLAPFFGDAAESTWWAMEVLPAVYGALIVFPVYAIGRAQFGREAGLLGALFIAVNSGHISHSTISLADHDSYVIFFGTCAFFFFMRALTEGSDARWVADWRSAESIKRGFADFLQSERLALGYAGLAGMTLVLVALSWKGFPYLMVILVIYLVSQMVINQFRRVDSLTTAMLGIVALSLPILLALPYYWSMGFISPWWDAPAYILLAFIGASVLLVPTRDLPWLLVLGGTVTVATLGYLLLTYVFTDLGFLLFSGQGYFVRTKLFDTIAEAQPPTFANFVFSFGLVSVWFGFFGLIWMAWQLFANRLWKKDYLLILIWAAVALYMAQSAIRFIFNATPVMALLSGWVTWLLIERAGFGDVLEAWRHYWGRHGPTILFLALGSLLVGFLTFFTVGPLVGFLVGILLLALMLSIGHMAAGEDQYSLRDRLSGLRRAFEIKRPAIAFVVVGLLLLPNAFYGYDAAVPYDDKKDHDTGVYDFLRYSLLRPEEYQYDQRNNISLYPDGVSGMYNRTGVCNLAAYTTKIDCESNSGRWSASAIWYMGITGPSFPASYWIDGLEWLAEQDTELPQEDRPGFISWWDYGFWAIDIGEHPTVADNFQFGYQMAGNFITAQSEEDALALLLYRLVEPEVDRESDRFPPAIREIMLTYYSEDNVTALEQIIANPGEQVPEGEDINKRNAAIRAGRPVLASASLAVLADAIYDVEQATGHSIRYFGADTRLMPYSAENTGIFYAPVTLADYELNDFVAVSLGLSNGQIVTYEEADELLRNDPTLTVTSQTLDYKQRFLNSMFYRAFIGWSGPDIGREATDGIPGISGEIGADTSLPPLPGWGLKHFKLAYANNGLRILKYYDGATINGVVQTEEGAPIPNATVTLLDEGGTPHDSVVTDALGRYSVVATAGNHTLMVSMGEFGSDIERVHLTSNNILAREVGILISEAQATRATQPEIRIDIEVEAASLSGELYWDAGEREPIAGIPVTATQTATGREFSVDSGADGSFAFDAIAPGEYRVTADLNGHELELANYEGVAGLQADQSLEIDGAVVPASVLGLIGPGIGYIPGMVSFTLEDHTNGTLMQREALTSFRFDNLLPGNYTLRLDNDNKFSEWDNNTVAFTLAAGKESHHNTTLTEGTRVSGVLSWQGEPVADEHLSITHVGGRHATEVTSDASGYFTTILPAGTYDLYALHSDANAAWLARIDSEAPGGLLDAAMQPAGRITGLLFNDRDGDGEFEEMQDETVVRDAELRFESVNGRVTVRSDNRGEYDVGLPPGDYTAYANYIDMDDKLAGLKRMQLDYGTLQSDLPMSPGHDLFVILIEEHLGMEMPISGLFTLDTTAGTVYTWGDEMATMVALPSGSYQPAMLRGGYEPLPPNDKYDHFAAGELQFRLVRTPVTVTGTVVYDGVPVPGAQLSFSPADRIGDYFLNFTADEEGGFSVELPPHEYVYSFTSDLAGQRYFAQGSLTLPLAGAPVSLGEVATHLLLEVGGGALHQGELKEGEVLFTSTSAPYDVTRLFATRFSGYHGWLPPGEYWVTFEGASGGSHYSHLSTLDLSAPALLHDLPLAQGHFINGALISEPTGELVDEDVTLMFISELGTAIARSNGLDGDYGPFDLQPGSYQLEITLPGFQSYSAPVEVTGSSYFNVDMIPETLPLTLNLTYRDADGVLQPLAGVAATFSREGGWSQTWTSDANGTIQLPEMVPARYDVSVDDYLDDGADQFYLERTLRLRPGNGHQFFDYPATWKARFQGSVFYDRNFDGTPDGDELLAGATVEIRLGTGESVLESLETDGSGSFLIYLKPDNYLLRAFSGSGTAYTLIESLDFNGSRDYNLSLERGVEYEWHFVASDDGSPVAFDDVRFRAGDELLLHLEPTDGTVTTILPPGAYNLTALLEVLDGSPDRIFVLDEAIALALADDGSATTLELERQLLRGADVAVDRHTAPAAVGQSVNFTFNFTGTGHRTTTFQAEVTGNGENWTAIFRAPDVSVGPGESREMVLDITPGDGVIPGVYRNFNVRFFWEGQELYDDVSFDFELEVTPTERPPPDFSISEVTWAPDNIEPGTEVTLQATVANTIAGSGEQFPQVGFYLNDELIEMTSTAFDGEGESVVEATWVASEGVHSFRVEVDPEELFSEQDETNNAKPLVLTVEAAAEEVEDFPWVMTFVVATLLLTIAYFALRLRR